MKTPRRPPTAPTRSTGVGQDYYLQSPNSCQVAMTPADIARALDEIAVLLQLAGESDFRAKAYSNAALAVTDVADRLPGLVANNRLGEARGLTGAIGDKVREAMTTGRVAYLEELRAATPPGLLAMIRVPGLGPKKAKALFDALKLNSLAELEAACTDGRVAKVKGFAAKSAERILGAVQFLRTAGDKLRYDRALRIGVVLLDPIAAMPGVSRAELAGELRRRCEIVERVTILVACDNPAAVLDAVAELDAVAAVGERAADRLTLTASVAYRTGSLTLPAEVVAVSGGEYALRLVQETGPAAHWDALISRAEGTDLDPADVETEDDLYRALGLHPVPPECRDWPDAIEVAAAGPFPTLLRDSDISGVFHNHTTASDGAATLAEMATAAGGLGYGYFGLGDHSQSLTIANGLTPERVRAQWRAVNEWNATNAVRVFRGTECDILAGGALDFDDELLAGFEYVVASVHSLFGLPADEQTARVCAALAHPSVTMLGHSTGRLLMRREGYKLDLAAVIDAAARHGKMIEINAQPDRLDLPWEWCRVAKAKGVPLVINPDAHSTADLEKVTFGVNVARRAGLTAADVFNTLNAAAVDAELTRRRF